MKFDGTPEEWDALVGKNKKTIQTDENDEPLNYFGEDFGKDCEEPRL